MSKQRMEQLLTNVKPILQGISTSEDQVEIDIEVNQSTESPDILSVDLGVIFLWQTDTADGQKYMDASIATGLAKITNASGEKIATAQGILLNIIDSSLEGLEVPGGEEKRVEVREVLRSLAKTKLEALSF